MNTFSIKRTENTNKTKTNWFNINQIESKWWVSEWSTYKVVFRNIIQQGLTAKLTRWTLANSGKKNSKLIQYLTKFWACDRYRPRYKRVRPVTMAVRPAPSTPSVTSSAVDHAENPDAPFHFNGHILLLLLVLERDGRRNQRTKEVSCFHFLFSDFHL